MLDQVSVPRQLATPVATALHPFFVQSGCTDVEVTCSTMGHQYISATVCGRSTAHEIADGKR